MDLVGRSQQLLELRKAWAVALSGTPRIVFIEGEGGVGKTALVRRFMADERGRRTKLGRPVVGTGQCVPTRHHVEHLRPIWDATYRILQAYDPEPQSSARNVHARLYSVASELGSVIPIASSASVGIKLAKFLVNEDGRLDIPLKRYRDNPQLLIRDTLLQTATRLPVIIFLDDLQWADPSTMALLANLFDIFLEQDEPSHLLLLAGVDPAEAARTGMVGKLRRRLESHDSGDHRLVFQVTLRGLKRDRARQLIERHTGGVPIESTALVDWLINATEGNPQQLSNLVRGLLASGQIVGDADRYVAHPRLGDALGPDALGERLRAWLRDLATQGDRTAAREVFALVGLQRLADDDRHLLAQAAVQGQRFSSQLLASVTGRDELDVAAALGRIGRAGVVEEIEAHPNLTLFGSGIFQFTNRDFVRALEATLPRRQRQLLHQRIAEVLVGRREAVQAELDRVAYEFQSLGQTDAPDPKIRLEVRRDRARRHVEALERALAHHAFYAGQPREAATLLTRVADRHLVTTYDDEFAETAAAVTAHGIIARCEELLGELVGAGTADRLEDVLRAEIALALTTARARAHTGRFDLALEYAEQAFDKARTLGEGHESVRVLVARLGLLYWSGQSERAREIVEELLSSHMPAIDRPALERIVEVLETWEHPEIAASLLGRLGEHLAALGEEALETHAVREQFRLLNAYKLDRWLTGIFDDERLSRVTVDARRHGLLEVWIGIILQTVEREVRSDWLDYARFMLASHDRQSIAAGAARLLERSERTSNLAARAARATDMQDIPYLDARSRIWWAQLFGTWRRRGRKLVDRWEALSATPGRQQPTAVAQLAEAIAPGGRLGPERYEEVLRDAISHADRQRIAVAQLGLRAELLRLEGLDTDDIHHLGRQLQELTEKADAQAHRIFMPIARAAVAARAGRRDQALAMAEGAEALASRLYSRLKRDEQVWLSAVVADCLESLGETGRARRWYRREREALEAVGRHEDQPSCISAREVYGARTGTPMVVFAGHGTEAADDSELDVRSLLLRAEECEAVPDDALAEDYYNRALERVEGHPEGLGLVDEIYEALADIWARRARACHIAGDRPEVISEHAQRALVLRDRAAAVCEQIGDWRGAGRLLRGSLDLAAAHLPDRVRPLAARLVELATDRGDIATLAELYDALDLLCNKTDAGGALQVEALIRVRDRLTSDNLALLRAYELRHIETRWTGKKPPRTPRRTRPSTKPAIGT